MLGRAVAVPATLSVPVGEMLPLPVSSGLGEAVPDKEEGTLSEGAEEEEAVPPCPPPEGLPWDEALATGAVAVAEPPEALPAREALGRGDAVAASRGEALPAFPALTDFDRLLVMLP